MNRQEAGGEHQLGVRAHYHLHLLPNRHPRRRTPPAGNRLFLSVMALRVKDKDATCPGPVNYQKVEDIIKKFGLE